MRATLSFLSRNRYRNVIEMLAFYDDAGYRNLRSLQNHYRTMFKAGQLNNLAAIRYNLRRFSLINRNLGRKSADAALRNHYKMIEEKAGKDGIVCRLDADNFVAVCKKDNLDELLACLEEANVIYDEREGKTVEISANAGVFVIPDGFLYAGYDDIWNRLIHSYMEAMTGKYGHIVFYNETVESNRFKIEQVQHSFHDALRKEEFFAVYQPKYHIKTGKIIRLSGRKRYAAGVITESLCFREILFRHWKRVTISVILIFICLTIFAETSGAGWTRDAR